MTEDVPGYRVLEQVGEGGFSLVYRAHQERLDRMVALKVLSISAVDDAAMRRFQRECKITGRLSGHPNIVTVLDTGMTGSGRPYIAMEYFEHGALSDRLAREGPLGVAEVLRVGVKMAGALAATHETDVLHRDVKPQNVLLSRYGEPALADFGIARLVDSFDATHTQAFTPHHAAPEILQGSPPGVGADIYSLGSTLYQLLAGQPAFKGRPDEGIAPLVLRVMNDPPPAIPRPDVPRRVQEVIGRAMAKAPAQRFGTAVEFAQALQSAQAELGLPVTDLAAAGASTLPRPPAPSTGAPPGRPPFPDVSGPPPVPEWAPTARGTAPPLPPPTAPAAAAGTDTSPWHPAAARSTTAPSPGYPAYDAAPPPLQAAPHAPVPPAAPGAPHTGPQDGPSRGLIVAVCVALVGGLALGIGALLASGGEPPEENPPAAGGESPATAPSAPVEPVTAEQIAAARPRKLQARAAGNGVVLAWKLPPAAREMPLLLQREPPGSEPIKSMTAGSTRTAVSPLAPNGDNCFRIGAVLRVNQGTAPDVAWSQVACVKGRGQAGS
ncbi:serine/threonine-protein kinase [Actinomadura algeriensis]|uniref:non-specific serine/threonine protein kinase n=1 Tax=Actinomadura algeriensis TaxID=1679523 RepID=A0ABR9K4A5_9ACTN|nr:serine/threonine-protein kinase [Actinomadura algeriensis]MBE1537434.1 serine/threonine protein kinase [Actinomadura algeriensis]